MEKHVFLLQVHKQPDLLARILKRLEAKNHYFFINIDLKCDNHFDFINITRDIKNVYFTKRFNVMHGGFSQVECTIFQIKEVYKYIPDFDYLHTISGQDYPCVSTEEFDSFFHNNKKSYMMLDTKEELKEWKKNKYPHRLEHWYVMDIFNAKWMNKIHLAGIVRRLIYWIPRKYKYMDEICGGWNWFSLNKRVVEYLRGYIDDNPEFIKRFRYTSSSDELIFSTILSKVEDELEIEKRNSLRFVEWHPKRETKALPLTLNENEFNQIINSGAFFCRKVDEKISAKLLDMIDDCIDNKKYQKV